MWRAVAAVLLLANLAFFAWTRGWLGLPAPDDREREPQRLAAQHRPEVVTVLLPTAASAAVTAARDAARACLEAGPFDGEGGAELAAAEGALAQAQLPASAWQREPAPEPPLWLVFAGRWPEAAARGARVEELRKLRLEVEPIAAPAELAPGLALSRHATKAEADAALAGIVAAAGAQNERTLRGLRVVQLPAPPPRHLLRVPRADADQQARLAALPQAASAALGGGLRPCAARP